MRIMKKTIFLFLAAIMAVHVYGQITEDEDGLLYDKDGELYHGLYTESYDGGSKRLEMIVRSGYLDGEYKQYFENGQVKEQRFYKNGKFDSTWVTWNEEGVKVGEARYRKDK